MDRFNVKIPKIKNDHCVTHLGSYTKEKQIVSVILHKITSCLTIPWLRRKQIIHLIYDQRIFQVIQI